MQALKNLKISTKFIIWFLAISLIPLAVAIYISYRSSRGALEREVTTSLIAVADNKANQIENYSKSIKKDSASLAYMSEIVTVVEKFSDAVQRGGMNSPDYAAVKQEYQPMMSYYQRTFGYDNIYLVDSKGDILFTTKGAYALKSIYEAVLKEKPSELAAVFVKAKASQETEVSSFEYHESDKETVIYLATPVFKGAALVGFVIVEINNRGVSDFVRDYTGLGQTGETIVASRIGQEAVFIAPSRFDPQATFKRKVTIGSSECIDIQNAARGERGSGVVTDYRNNKVLAAWTGLPTFALGMVVKMDTAEVFTAARILRNTLLKISLILLLLVAGAAVILARSVSSPITELTKVSSVIAAGDLSARAAVSATDEIGELAASFNKMTDSLVEAKARVEEQKALLEEANKELDNFVYTVSHDLRAPLRGIEGFANFLEQDYAAKIDEQGKEFIKRIRSGTKRMQQLIDDLLELSRISRIKNPYEDVDMGDLIRSVAARIEFDIKEHKVELKISSRLPIIRCDKIKMQELFLNLINNAVKFSSKIKDTHPIINVGYNELTDAHEFFVKDNGIGIDPKYHKEIFGIFKRLHKQEDYEGTGAGLSIVKRIIDDHEGRIWIDSELGKGAAFFFTIPKKLMAKKKLGEILVEQGSVSEEEIKKALEKQGKERSADRDGEEDPGHRG